MGKRDTVVLVGDDGRVLGSADKLAAHVDGQLHLAFSIVLYRNSGELLLQQRAAGKYHFPLSWANACCSHPGPGEELRASATSRVVEELGLSVELQPAGQFIYRAVCPTSGLIEYELDHVFVAVSDETPRPDPAEVAATRWVDSRSVIAGALDLPVVPWLVTAVQLADAARIDHRADG